MILLANTLLAWLIPLGVVLILAVWVIAIYNGLVRKKINVDNGYAQIDVQLKRRYDLIPNLIETVKGYAAHEKDTLERVVKARQQAIGAKGVADQAVAENMLTGALRQLFALSESYPNLKANENFLALQEELASTENKISYARQFYNDMVTRLNTAIQSFPSNIIANIFSFEQRQFFEVEVGEQREAVAVKF